YSVYMFFVVGVSLHHGICDASLVTYPGAKFLKGLAEMARGYDKPSMENQYGIENY
ncbi:hypothetical protein KI387_043613, partial [Taxus chinensis]